MVRCIADYAQIEYRAFAAWMHADLPGWTDQPLRNQRRSDSERFEHVESGRMKGRCAQIIGQFRLCFVKGKRDFSFLQQHGCCKTYGPRTYDYNGFYLFHLVQTLAI